MVEKAKLREDGWQNVLTGQGVPGIDKKRSTTFTAETVLTQAILTYLYMADGLCKKIVDVPVDDMVREWFKVNGDTDGLILKRFEELDTKAKCARALRWGSLFGGAIIAMGIDDGGKFEDELNEETIKKIDFLRVFDRWRAVVKSYYDDKENPKYGLPMEYTVSPYNGSPFTIHETRTLRFEGSDVPELVRKSLQGWGLSDVQPIWERLRAANETYLNAEHIISEFIIGVLTIENLQELISSGQEELVKKRLNLIDLSKHIINTILLDNEEKFERVTSRVTGLDDVITKMEQALAAVARIPQTKLFGTSPKGMNATGESDIRLYYDGIAGLQEERLLPAVKRLATLTMKESEGDAKIKSLDDWGIEFNPLWQPTEKEIAETHKVQAETDSMYADHNILTSEEIRDSRFGGEVYSYDTHIEKDGEFELDKATPDELDKIRKGEEE